MQVTQQDNGKKGVFSLQDGDQVAGEMSYTWAGEHMFIIDSTHVDDGYRGQNVGQTLLDSAIAFARERHIKILPLCPFAKAMFDKHPEFADVLNK